MIAFDEGQEDVGGEDLVPAEGEEVQPEIAVAFTPAQLAVGTNLMALGLAVMTNNGREGKRIMEQLGDPKIGMIALDATRRMAAALTGAPDDLD
jgi:hypothetical protein